MQLHSSTSSIKAESHAINELAFGSNISSAVEQNRRADFSLLLAMFSENVLETAPIETIDTPQTPEHQLRSELEVPSPQQLSSDASSYLSSAEIAKQFHCGGLHSAQLQNSLRPDALSYNAENTHGLGEDVYSNLSYHTKRNLNNHVPAKIKTTHLYQDLVVAHRTNQVRIATA